MESAAADRRLRVRRSEAIDDRLRRRRRQSVRHVAVVRRVLTKSEWTNADRGTLLGACLCLLEEARLSHALVAVRV